MWKSNMLSDGIRVFRDRLFTTKLTRTYFFFKISIFDQNFDFWPKFRFLTKISIFDQNFDFWPKFRFSIKISIFDQNFDFWSKFRIWRIGPFSVFLFLLLSEEWHTKTFDFWDGGIINSLTLHRCRLLLTMNRKRISVYKTK